MRSELPIPMSAQPEIKPAQTGSQPSTQKSWPFVPGSGSLGARLMTSRTRHPGELKQIACPILFISGDEDIVIPPFAADAIARVVPGSKVAHIEDAGHSAYFERAETFNRIVDEFFGHLK